MEGRRVACPRLGPSVDRFDYAPNMRVQVERSYDIRALTVQEAAEYHNPLTVDLSGMLINLVWDGGAIFFTAGLDLVPVVSL